MEFIWDNFFLIITGVALIAGGAFWGYNRYKKPHPGNKQSNNSTLPLDENNDAAAEEIKPALCRVYDAVNRTISNQELSASIIKKIRADYKNLGRIWNFEGKYVYAIDKLMDENGNIFYRPKKKKPSLDNSAGRLFRVLQQHDTVKAYDTSEKRSFLKENMKYLIFVGVVIFFMWTIIVQ